MSASTPSGGRIAAENELLAQLGLSPSATPEDIDATHLAASHFLAAAPSSLKAWARAQAAALDEAYLQLTDPVGLEGSALKSPTRPPTVEPGGPATPPARRDLDAALAPAAAPVTARMATATATAHAPAAADELDAAGGEAADEDDFDALYASVTPSVNADMLPSRTGKGTKRERRETRRAAAAPALAQPAATGGPNIWKRITLGGTAVLALAALLLAANAMLSGGSGATANGGTNQPSATAQAVDLAKVNTLMEQLAANPNDVTTLVALGDEYYFGNQYDVAGKWYDKALAIDPKNVKALNAKGAVQFSANDLAGAAAIWKQVLTLDANNTEAHFNLAFLYFYQPNPDLTAAVREWKTVVALDPSSTFAQVSQQHLDSLAAKSMLPGASPSGSQPSTGPGPSGSPAASGAAASPAAPAGAAAPSGSPAPSTGRVVTESAKDLAFANGSLTAPASTAFTLRFSNQDAGLPHDMMIKDASGNTVFKGDLVTGPTTVDYSVPALAAGTYTFTCSIHPTTMNGTLVVGS